MFPYLTQKEVKKLGWSLEYRRWVKNRRKLGVIWTIGDWSAIHFVPITLLTEDWGPIPKRKAVFA